MRSQLRAAARNQPAPPAALCCWVSALPADGARSRPGGTEEMMQPCLIDLHAIYLVPRTFLIDVGIFFSRFLRRSSLSSRAVSGCSTASKGISLRQRMAAGARGKAAFLPHVAAPQPKGISLWQRMAAEAEAQGKAVSLGANLHLVDAHLHQLGDLPGVLA